MNIDRMYAVPSSPFTLSPAELARMREDVAHADDEAARATSWGARTRWEQEAKSLRGLIRGGEIQARVDAHIVFTLRERFQLFVGKIESPRIGGMQSAVRNPIEAFPLGKYMAPQVLMEETFDVQIIRKTDRFLLQNAIFASTRWQAHSKQSLAAVNGAIPSTIRTIASFAKILLPRAT